MFKSIIILGLSLFITQNTIAQNWLSQVDTETSASGQIELSDFIQINDSTNAILLNFVDTFWYNDINNTRQFLVGDPIYHSMLIATINDNGRVYHAGVVSKKYSISPRKLLWQHNRIIALGTFNSQFGADFDFSSSDFSLKSNGISNDIFIAKYHYDLKFDTALAIGGSSRDWDGDMLIDACVDKDQNILMCGYYSGTTDFDPSTATFNLSTNNGRDIFIAKYDSTFNFKWAKSIGGVGTTDIPSGIATDTSNNVYVIGTFTGSVDFNPGAGTYFRTSMGMRDAFVLSLDFNGELRWIQQQQSSTSNVSNSAITVFNDNVFISGSAANLVYLTNFSTDTMQLPSTYNSGYITKLATSSGKLLHKMRYRGYSQAQIQGLQVYSENLYITGVYREQFKLTNGTQLNSIALNAGSYDIVIGKYNLANNKWNWLKSYGGSGNDYGCKLIHNPNGLRFAFQSSSDSLLIIPDSQAYNLTGPYNLISGRLVWNCKNDTTEITREFCSGDSVLINGNYYSQSGLFLQPLIGRFSCDSVLELNLVKNPIFTDSLNVHLCNDESVEVAGNIINQAGNFQYTLQTIKGCDSVLNVVARKTVLDTALLRNDTAYYAKMDADSIHWFECNNPTIVLSDTHWFTPPKSGAYRFVKWNDGCQTQSRCFSHVITRISTFPKESLFHVNQGQLYIAQDVELSAIYNLNGQKMFNYAGRNMSLARLNSGVYLLELIKNNETYLVKLVL